MEAREAYYKAVAYDRMPIRALPAQNEFIRGLIPRTGVCVADAVEALENEAPEGLIGFNLMTDAHHPNVKGYIAVARRVAECIQVTRPRGRLRLVEIDDDLAKRLFRIGREKSFDISIYVGRWMTRLATWRYDPAERLRLAAELFSRAVELNPRRSEGYLGLAVVSGLRNDSTSAHAYIAKAAKLDRGYTERYLNQRWVQSVMRVSPDKGQ
jgi:hypothetical protein